MATTHTVTLACDHAEAEQFAGFLRSEGHETTIGADTHSHVDGVDVSTERGCTTHAAYWLSEAWSRYCDA